MKRSAAVLAGVFMLLFLLGSLMPAHAKKHAKVPLVGSVVIPNTSQISGAPTIMPAEGVTVVIQETGQTMKTNVQGSFWFEAVPEGDITILASKPGVGEAVKHVTIVGPEANRVLVYINGTSSTNAMNGYGGTPNANGTGFSTQQPATRPDTIFVSFSTPPNGGGNSPTSTMLSGPPQTNNSTLGAIQYGADPFTMGGRPPTMMTGPNSYQTAITAASNAIMMLDPDQPLHGAFLETAVRTFWMAFNPAGTKLFVSTDQQNINVYDTVNNNACIAQIPAGGIVTDMQLCGSYIYCSIMGSNPSVLVLDPTAASTIRNYPIRTGSTKMQPRSVTATSDGRAVFVAMDGGTSGAVLVLDGGSGQAVKAIPVGAQPLGLAMTPDNRYVLCANSRSSSVSVINTATMTEVARPTVGAMPVRIAVRRDGTKAYVSCKAAGTVQVINLQSMSAGNSIPVGGGPMGIAVTGTGSRVFVACTNAGNVAIIDGINDVFLKATTAQPRANPYGVAVKP
jgi:YVTN family beta-propeller protein